jgi:hypothetical protein
MKSWLIVANNAEFDRRNLCGAAHGGWGAHYFALSTRGHARLPIVAQPNVITRDLTAGDN